MKTKHILLMTVFLAGCSLTPDYHRPTVSSPQQWSIDSTSPSTAIAYEWWESFESDELNGLMQHALANNNDILAGLQRIEQSRASARIAGASLLPTAGGTAGASRSRTDPAQGSTRTETNLNAGLNISYELDLFGRNAAGVDASRSRLAASQFDQDALALVVMGDVASRYFSLVNLRERLVVADENLANAREILRIVQARVREGMESDIELAQQESAVASSMAARASLVEQTANADNALAVLLGQAPQTLAVDGLSLSDLSVPAIVPEQPSNLLQRRPDIRSAEQSLIAANADIGAARAAFFPSVTLGLGGSVSLPAFGDPATTALSLASSLTAPIFQGGRLEGGVEQASARQKELVEQYKKAVLVSFQEVEDALAAVKAAEEREAALLASSQNAQRSYDLTKKRYDAGSIDFRALLDAQTALLSARDTYTQAKLARLNAAVSLYKALGGGWNYYEG